MTVEIDISHRLGKFSLDVRFSAPAGLTALFGLVGYALIKFGFEPAPLLLGFVLGRLLEEKLRQALVLSHGNFMTFVERPVSAVLAWRTRTSVDTLIAPAHRVGFVIFAGSTSAS